MSKVYVGDVGTELIADVGASLTGATLLRIDVQKPAGTVVQVAATALGDTSIKGVAPAGLFSEAGVYRLQSVVAFGAVAQRGETSLLRVYAEYQ